MNHEERRTTLQFQHRQLRAHIGAVRASARALKEGGATGSLRGQIAALATELEAHMATEEALLGPVLERLDAWGPVRLDLMRADHIRQREAMAFFRSKAAEALRPADLVGRVLGLLDEILSDMDLEDRDLLDAKVLRDDVIQLDASDS